MLSGGAENQALVKLSAEHVLLHTLVKYTIHLALQHTFAYTRYNHVLWALGGGEAATLCS